jgi:hypothetical protein
MKHKSSAVRAAGSGARQSSDPVNLLKRIKLEFLDEYVCEKRGYDPYDTSRGRAPDIWRAKPKRA